MPFPEGSPEKREARAVLIRSARFWTGGRRAWLVMIRKIAPDLIVVVGEAELDLIANYTWG